MRKHVFGTSKRCTNYNANKIVKIETLCKMASNHDSNFSKLLAKMVVNFWSAQLFCNNQAES